MTASHQMNISSKEDKMEKAHLSCKGALDDVWIKTSWKTEAEEKNSTHETLSKNENAILSFKDASVVLSSHEDIPFGCRMPNIWRTNRERYWLNRYGRLSFYTQLRSQHKAILNYIAEQKIAIEDERLDFLKEESNVIDMIMPLMDNTIIENRMNIRKFLQSPLSDLKKEKERAEQSYLMFDVIDDMPDAVREVFTGAIHLSSDLNSGYSVIGSGYFSEQDLQWLLPTFRDLYAAIYQYITGKNPILVTSDLPLVSLFKIAIRENRKAVARALLHNPSLHFLSTAHLIEIISFAEKENPGIFDWLKEQVIFKRAKFEALYPCEDIFDPVPSIAAYWKKRHQALSIAGKPWKTAGQKQAEYKQFCASAVREAVRRLEAKDSQLLDAKTLVCFFGTKRGEIAERHGDTENKFGVVRGDQSLLFESIPKTGHPFSSQVVFLKERIHELLQRDHPDIKSKIIKSGEQVIYDVQIYGDAIDHEGHAIKVMYSRILHVDDPSDSEQHTFTMHMHGCNMESAFRYVKQLQKEILDLKEKKEVNAGLIQEKILPVLWHLYNIMILHAGSSSVTLMVKSTLSQLFYIVPMPNDTPFSPDFNAFSSLPNEYSETKLTTKVVEAKKNVKEIKECVLPKNESLVLKFAEGDKSILLINDDTPFSCRIPNIWRTPYERLILNSGGKKELINFLENLHNILNRIAQGKQNIDKERLAFLQNVSNFSAIAMRFVKDLSFFDIINKILDLPIDQLKKYKEIGEQSYEIFDRIDDMPYSVREIFTGAIHRSSDLNSDYSVIGSGYFSEQDLQWLLPATRGLYQDVLKCVEDKDPILAESDHPLTSLFKIAIRQKNIRMVRALLLNPSINDLDTVNLWKIVSFADKQDLALFILLKGQAVFKPLFEYKEDADTVQLNIDVEKHGNNPEVHISIRPTASAYARLSLMSSRSAKLPQEPKSDRVFSSNTY